MELVVAAGISNEAGWTALKNLEQVCNVCSYWDSDKKTVFFAVIDWSSEEKMRSIADQLWFENLPG